MSYAFDSISAWPRMHAHRHRGRTAISDSRRSITYGQLDDRVEHLAGRLFSSGVSHGDRVCVVMKNRVEFLELLFACARVGAIFTPVNYRLAPAEIAQILEDAEPKLLVAEPELNDLVTDARKLLSTSTDVEYWDDLAEPGDEAFPRVPDRAPQLSDAAMMLYTSGTTGQAKGVILTHENLHWNSVNAICDWGLLRGDSTLVVNPMFHSVMNILAIPLLLLGGHVRLMEDFDPSEALSIIRTEQVSVMFAVATAWQMLDQATEATEGSLENLRLAASGGMAAPVSLIERFHALDIPFVQAYGLTETAPLATTVLVEDALEAVGSIGRAFVNVEVKVAGESGAPAPAGTVGELYVRGRNVSPGYWRREEETQAVFLPDGWFRTGDMATMDDSGNFYIVDRIKDLIISGGENISSIEIEQALHRHPDVLDVAVVAAPSNRWGETPHAYVVCREGTDVTEDDLIAHCRGLIARFKCPSSVQFMLTLPRTATGKVRKDVLRQGLDGDQ